MKHLSPDHRAARSFCERSHQLYINGQWTGGQSPEAIGVVDPADGSGLSALTEAGPADVDAAVSAARNAFESGPWPAMSPSERMKTLHAIADGIETSAQEFAVLETLDNGKPLQFSSAVDVPAAAGAFRYFAGWADKIRGHSMNLSMPGDQVAYSLNQPVGVVALIVPWNFPLVMAAAKLAPALAAGCTCVLKPAEETSLTALRLMSIIEQAGVPPGVVNVLTGRGETTGRALAEHGDVDKVAFTGSTEVGRAIVGSATGNLKRVGLELGGKAPNIVFPDADLDKAITGSAMGICFNSGQVCTASSRLYVHRSVYDQVLEGVAQVAQSLKLGPGMEPDTQLGPLISARQLERVSSYVALGAEQGGELICGGRQWGDQGFFIEPTVIAGVDNTMRVTREEIFGPVLAAQAFDDEDEVIALANDSDFGLSASVWTRDINLAHRAARRIKAGVVGINTQMAADWDMPVGGFKQSGWGRENGWEGLSMYLEKKAVVVDLQ